MCVVMMILWNDHFENDSGGYYKGNSTMIKRNTLLHVKLLHSKSKLWETI